MNKNSRTRQKMALKNFSRGQNATTFEILATMPNSKQLGIRKLTIQIGHAQRKSKNPKVAAKNYSSNGQESN